MKESDKQLIDRFKDGQTKAFDTLVLRYQERLFSFLLRSYVRSRDEAEDVAQEAFLNAYRKIDSFRGESSFSTWLFTIARNVALSRKRKQQRSPTSLDAVTEAGGDQTIDQNPSSKPAYQIELSERQKAVLDALSELSEEYRVVIVLKEIEGLKYQEIAEVVGCKIGTVRSRIFRARMELTERLTRHLSD